jgi:hypothetical protein
MLFVENCGKVVLKLSIHNICQQRVIKSPGKSFDCMEVRMNSSTRKKNSIWTNNSKIIIAIFLLYCSQESNIFCFSISFYNSKNVINSDCYKCFVAFCIGNIDLYCVQLSLSDDSWYRAPQFHPEGSQSRRTDIGIAIKQIHFKMYAAQAKS